MRNRLPIFAALGLLVGAHAWAQEPVPPEHGGILESLEQGPKGMLAIRAIQGTKDGLPVAGDEVEITLFHREIAVKQITGVLDGDGVLLVGDIPVSIGIVPLVRIRHAGVQYQDAAPEMSAENASAKVDITVYEVTDAAPTWNVVMRHMMVEKRDAGYVVSDMVVVDNLGDKTWMGEPPDMLKRRATIPLPLPSGASDIELVQGFHGWCCSALKDSTLQVQMPFMPGKMTYKFAYRVTPHDGVTDLRVTMPAECGRVAFFAPDDGTVIEPTLVKAAGADTSGAQRLTMFQAEKVPAGQIVGVVLKNPVPAAAPVATQTAKSGRASPVILIAGGIAAIGAVAIAWKVMSGRAKGV